MKSLKWRQVNAWRLSQHCLAPRLHKKELVKAVSNTLGMQAQLMSAAQLAMSARTDGLVPRDVQSALWQDHILLKTWVMRGTLHLIAADELPLYVAARSAQAGRNWLKYFTYFGITPMEYKAFIEAVPEVLGNEPMTRKQLANGIAERIGAPKLGRLLLSSSWGSLWKPSALRGDLCFGPSQGKEVTFVNPKKWIAKEKSMEPYRALQEIVRRYLCAFGPSTPELFALWWELGIVPARKLFQSIEQEIELVDVEGWKAFALKKNIELMETNLSLRGVVRLLPLFDAYTLGLSRGSDLEPLLSRTYQKLVYRPQGWVSAVVLVDGYLMGVWDYTSKNSETMTVRVRMFAPPTAHVRRHLKEEVERVGSFLGAKAYLEFEK